MMMPITSTEKNARSVAGGAAAADRESWPIRRSGYIAAAPVLETSFTIQPKLPVSFEPPFLAYVRAFIAIHKLIRVYPL